MMSEEKKRFFESLYSIIDRKYGRNIQANEIIDLLNEQYNEIKKLKKENEELQNENKRKNNEIESLRNAYFKIPKGIREVWND